MDPMMQNGAREKCRCGHHSIFGGVVFLLGLLFLLGAFDVFSDRMVEITWPILVMIAGIFKIGGNRCKCC